MKPIITVTDKAKQLIQEFGHEHAIKYFQDKIDELGKPQNFDEVCRQSGWMTAIDYIKTTNK